jgi:hypothetical protein
MFSFRSRINARRAQAPASVAGRPTSLAPPTYLGCAQRMSAHGDQVSSQLRAKPLV